MMYRCLTTLAMAAVAGSTAYMSVCGLVAVFPGAPVLIVILGSGVELGKLLLVVHLHRTWGRMPRAGRFFYSAVTGVLVLLTSCEVLGFLSLTHKAALSGAEAAMAKDAGLAREAALISRQVETLEETLAGLPEGYVTRRIAERERAGIGEKEARLVAIERERLALAGEMAGAARRAGPVFAAADILGLGHGRVSFCFLLMLVVILEPLSLGLTVAVSAAWQSGRPAAETGAAGPAEPSAAARPATEAADGQTAATLENTGVADVAGRDLAEGPAGPAAAHGRPETAGVTGRPNHKRLMAIQDEYSFTVEELVKITGRKQMKTVRAWLDPNGQEVPVKALRKIEKYIRGRPLRVVRER